jgi:hypothetical protein
MILGRACLPLKGYRSCRGDGGLGNGLQLSDFGSSVRHNNFKRKYSFLVFKTSARLQLFLAVLWETLSSCLSLVWFPALVSSTESTFSTPIGLLVFNSNVSILIGWLVHVFVFPFQYL